MANDPLRIQLATAEAKTLEVAQLARQAARALADGDAENAARKLEEAAMPDHEKHRAELLAKKTPDRKGTGGINSIYVPHRSH
jgi:hypothetical protein